MLWETEFIIVTAVLYCDTTVHCSYISDWLMLVKYGDWTWLTLTTFSAYFKCLNLFPRQRLVVRRTLTLSFCEASQFGESVFLSIQYLSFWWWSTSIFDEEQNKMKNATPTKKSFYHHWILLHHQRDSFFWLEKVSISNEQQRTGSIKRSIFCLNDEAKKKFRFFRHLRFL